MKITTEHTHKKMRTKHVFPTGEIAHKWAHQTQDSARNGSNVSFRGADFYSYSTAIARRLLAKYPKGRPVFVLDDAFFSMTTRKHQRLAHYAVGTELCFTVSCGRHACLPSTGSELRDYYVAAAKALHPDVGEKTITRARRIKRKGELLNEAFRAALVFGLTHRLIDREIEKLGLVNEAAKQFIDDYERRIRERAEKAAATRAAAERLQVLAEANAYLADATDKLRAPWHTNLLPKGTAEQVLVKRIRIQAERNAAILAERIESARAYVADTTGEAEFCDYLLNGFPDDRFPDDLKAAVKAKQHAENAEKERFAALELPEKIAAWQRGERNVRLPGDCPCLLRAKGADMETSKGARVPLADAQRAYRFAQLMRVRGWHRNGEQFKVGDYYLDAVNDFGVIAGCHRVSWAECERFACAMGWTTTEEQKPLRSVIESRKANPLPGDAERKPQNAHECMPGEGFDY